jgi:hypothetical protein
MKNLKPSNLKIAGKLHAEAEPSSTVFRYVSVAPTAARQ